MIMKKALLSFIVMTVTFCACADVTYSMSGSMTETLKVWYDGQEEALQGTPQPVTVAYQFTESAGKLNVDLDFGDKNIVGLVARVNFDGTVNPLAAGNKVSFEFNDNTFADGQQVKVQIWYVAAKTGDEKFPEFTYVYGKGVENSGQGGDNPDDPQPTVIATSNGGGAVKYTPENADASFGYISYTCDALSDGSLNLRYDIKDNVIGLVPKLQYTVGEKVEWINEAVSEGGRYSFAVKGPFENGQEIILNLVLAYAGGQSELSDVYKFGSDEDMTRTLEMSAEITDVTETSAKISWKAFVGNLEVPATLVYSIDNANSVSAEATPVALDGLVAANDYTVTCSAATELSGEKLQSAEVELKFRTPDAVEDSIGDLYSESDAKVEYYNLNGVRINYPATGTVVICKRGTDISKIVVR